MVCTNCRTQSPPKMKVRGLFAVELLLWICFIIPGLIYTMWRLQNKYTVCPVCGAENMIPLHSPKARELIG